MLVFSSTDPIVSGAITSGVARTQYSLNQLPASIYYGPFSLSVSTYSAAYYSADYAGNVESTKTASFVVGLSTSVPATSQAQLLKALSVSSTSVALSWDSGGNPLGALYNIYYGPASGGASCPSSIVGQPQSAYAFMTQAALTGLAPGTAYQFQVCAQGPSLQSPCSNSILATTPASGAGQLPPTFSSCGGTNPPGPAVVAAISTSSVSLAWDLNGNPLGTNFTVAYGPSPQGNACAATAGSLPYTVTVATAAAVIGGLAARSPYVFVVCNPASGNACGGPISVNTAYLGAGVEAYPNFNSCVGSGPGGSGGGLAMAADVSGNLWEVVDAAGVVELAKYSSSAVPLALMTLPGASSNAEWSVSFDTTGAALAVGALGTGAMAAYQVDSTGANLLSSATFNGNGMAFESAAGRWITGAYSADGQSFAAGLWRFDPDQSLLALTTSYSRGAGVDAGFGVRLDPAGNIWVVGISSNPAGTGPNQLDLALWKFSPDGTSLLAGPFLRPGYQQDAGGSVPLNAKLAIGPGGIYAASRRLSNLGNNDLALVRYDLSGNLLAERFWRASPSADVLPLGLSLDASGNPVISGSVTDGNSTTAGLWFYRVGGDFQSAQSVPGAAEADDLAFSGANLWLSVDDSTAPLSFAQGQVLPGFEGTSDDLLPPMTLAVFGDPFFEDGGVFITSMTAISLNAVDDLNIPGDGMGVGVAQSFYSIDSSTFGVYSGPFYIQSESSHTLQFYSIDALGHAAAPRAIALAVDNSPPSTRISFSSILSTAPLTIDGSASIALSAQDGGSGVGGTYVSLDGAAFAAYTSTFTLPVGSHTIAYYSIDNVGNAGNSNRTTVIVAPTQASGPTEGLAIAADAGGNLWEIVDDNGSTELARYGPDGSFQASAVLPGAGLPSDNWSLSFDSSGNALAVDGMENGSGNFVSLWRVSPSMALLSSGAFAGSAVALDSTGGAWISGLVTPDGQDLSLALWKYDPAQNLLNLTTTYSRGAGLDVGLGIAQDAAANIWVVGYSSNPVSPGPNGIDLALWKFSPDGTALLSGPFTRPGYEQNTNGNFNAKIAVSTNAVFAAASRLNAQGTSDLALAGFTLSGSLIIEQSFPQENPLSMTLAPAGGVAVEASSGGPSGLFLYDAAGNFLSARAAGSSNDLSYSGSNLWLSINDSSAPIRFQGGAALSGTNVVYSSGTAVIVPMDSLPPRTAFAAGLPQVQSSSGTIVGRATPLNLSSIDDFTTVGDARGLGVAFQTLSVDGIFRSSFTDPTPGAGQVFSTTFTLASDADGVHVLGFFAQDLVGNRESLQLSSVAVDATAPVTKLVASPSAYGAFVSSRTVLTLAAADPVVGGVASGVAYTQYQDNGGTFQTYVSSFSLVEGVHALAYQSRDNVGNVEILRSTAVLVDATPPVSAAAVGASSFTAADGTLYVTPGSSVTFSAVDPVSSGVASGLDHIEASADGAGFAAYVAALTFAEGRHAVLFRSIDRVGNVELARTLLLQSDNTPPQTSLSILGGRQFPGASPAAFYASSDTRFGLPALDPLVNGVASGLAFTRFQDNNGAFQSYVSTFGLAEGGHILAYQSQDRVQNTEVPRSTTVLVDATPPVTTVAIGSPTFTAADGTIYVSTTAPITFSAVDPALPTGEPGSGVNRIETALDGGPFVAYSTPIFLAEGRHVIAYRAIDNVANAEQTRVVAIQSDATPPISSLVIGAPQFQLPSILLVSSRTPLNIAAFDPLSNNVASGVKDTFFRISDIAPGAAPFGPYATTFTLTQPDVVKVIEFFSRDNVLNTEVVRSSSVLLDSTPPEIALLSPPSCDSGICRVLKGRFPVLGMARDLHFRDYQLESAAGQNAASGFALISSGTISVSSGTLGVWDTRPLSGWQTLRLTATDLVLNVSVLSINVFVGDPGDLLILGNHEVFRQPEGVAVGLTGNVYVADTNHDQIKVFTSTGGLLAAFGGHERDNSEAKGEEKGITFKLFAGRRSEDETRSSTAPLRLAKPKAVAVDASGNIYVANTNRDQILKLSPAGTVLLELGRRTSEKGGDNGSRRRVEFVPGRGPGEFNKPSGIAVDAAGSIYVADTLNRRVQVLSSTGGATLAFFLPPAQGGGRDENNGEEEREPSDLGTPVGIAVDQAGAIYVADPRGRRALVFDRLGALLLTIPIGSRQGRREQEGDDGAPGRPEGIAVSPDGGCILVSDAQRQLILKFDRQGRRTLVFGAHGRVPDNGLPPSRIVFNGPSGLALDSAQNLYVADRGNARIQVFGLPTGRPPLIVPPPMVREAGFAGEVVFKEEGGRVEREDGAGVVLPPNAIPEDLVVTVSPPARRSEAEAKDQRRAFEKKGLKPVSAPVDFGPSGVDFKFPATVTLPYNPAMADLFKAPEADLKVHRWEKGDWEALDSTVDRQKRTVSARTLSFSLYQVFAAPSALKVAAVRAPGDPTFSFCDLIVSPKTLRVGEGLTIRLQAGRADAVEAEIKDGGGNLVHSGHFNGPQLADIGNGKGLQFTFEHLWTPSGLPPGIYIITVTARKAGQSDIRLNGRIALFK